MLKPLKCVDKNRISHLFGICTLCMLGRLFHLVVGGVLFSMGGGVFEGQGVCVIE